jgi:type II secretory ATPase GspE/PulE/Tfp pilus assembly ATPase PilB-like protein/ActR/RegA family two-component response regulator
MPPRQIRDEWLLPTLESLLPAEALVTLKGEVGESYWETAVRRGLIPEDDLLAALSKRFRMRVANLMSVTQAARELVPEQLARKYRILPLAITDSVLDIATADPHDLDCERTLAFATGRTVRMQLASPLRIADRLEEVYRLDNAVDKLLQKVAGKYDVQTQAPTEETADIGLSTESANARPLIQLVDHILAEGIASRASDIHLEPEEAGVAIRYRIDGVLRQSMVLPRAVGVPLVSRIKIISGLDITDRLRPQDGRSRVTVNGANVDLRVSTLPASHGEKIVIRILDARSTVLSIDSLGLNPDEKERIQLLLAMREGVILVTGPTGSGKTTTLYSMLRHAQARKVNIVTVEDPVEYRLSGIVQVQVNEKAGLTFASALRSILRQDPDIVLVGEIRDKETATTAVQASLTGHLVLSTLHTIDAASSVTRLVDIGIESYKLAGALKGIVAQRLIRLLCAKCKRPVTEPVPERLRRWIPEGTQLYAEVGCPECTQTGYRGRRAITEVLIATQELERRVSANESGDRIAEAAREGGMKSLWESGMQHAVRGDTSVEELLRILEMPALPDARPRTTSRLDTPARRPAGPPSGPHPVVGSGGHRAITSARPAGPLARDEAFQLIDEVHAASAGKTVLIVEDEEPLRRVLRDLLERDGFQVLEASNGIQALDEIDRGAPDVVVLDLNLPQLDGFGVLSRLRAKPATAHLPVIVLTAQGDEDSEVRVLEGGADDFLTKPFRPRALSARLHTLLKRKVPS